jgi:transcriptional regulator with XRE-family HTH domain
MANRKKSPAIKRAFRLALEGVRDEAEKDVGVISQQQIAKQLNVASSAVNAWFKGDQIPRDRYLDGLAELFAANEASWKLYRSRLYAAAGRSQTAQDRFDKGLNLLEEKRSRKRIIRIGFFEYGAIGEFFRVVLEAFARYDGSELVIQQEQYRDLEQGIVTKRFGLGAPILATHDRSLHLNFIETPITIPINAFTFRGALRGKSEISFDPDRRAIKPILYKDEVGGRFAIHALGFNDSWQRHDVPYADPTDFADALFQCWSEWNAQTEERRQDQPIPVVFADELTCVSVQREWLKRTSASDPTGASAEPIFLLGKDPYVRVLGPQGLRPFAAPDPPGVQPIRCRVCICVDRDAENWPRYIADAWRIFLYNNSDFIAAQYARLYTDLLTWVAPLGHGSLRSAQDDFWRRRVREWLRLPKEAVENVEDALLSSDESLWRKIIIAADTATRVKSQ